MTDRKALGRRPEGTQAAAPEGGHAWPYTRPIEVRFNELDGIGHINNAVFHTYIEHARTHFLEDTGLSTPFSTGERIPIILARTEMDFIKPGFLNDQLTVGLGTSRVGTKSFEQTYEVISSTRGVIVRARAVLVWFDYGRNASVPLPPAAREVLSRYLIGSTSDSGTT